LRSTVEDKKRALIDNLVMARRDLLEAVQALSPDQVEVVFLGTWGVSDLVAHLVGWDYTNLQAVQEILAGQPPSFFQYYDKDWQTYNRTLVEKYKCLPFTALLADVENSQRQLITFLENVPAKTLIQGKARNLRGRSVSIQSLLRAEARDELTHADQVRAFFHLS
jgi:hypothetical protein